MTYDKVTLALLVLHLLLESSAKSVERVTTGNGLLTREEANYYMSVPFYK